MTAHPYIFFDSNCREAFAFYETLGIGKVTDMIANKDAPAGQEYDPARADNIMHASLKIGDTLLMASDMPANWYAKPQSFNIHLTVEDAAKADALFDALKDGGEVQMPLEKTFWAERFGACVDRYGIPWMISVDLPAA
jgi:PhnB protein